MLTEAEAISLHKLIKTIENRLNNPDPYAPCITESYEGIEIQGNVGEDVFTVTSVKMYDKPKPKLQTELQEYFNDLLYE